jgi:hypothetical protein
MGHASTIIVTIAAVTVGFSSGQADQPSAFDRPLQTTELFMYVPAGPGATPSDASEMGLLSRFARVSSVPFGFESDESAPRPSTASAVEMRSVTASTLRAALDGFVAMDPRYRWKNVGGAFVVRTLTAWEDPNDALNQPVHDIHWQRLDVLTTFNRIGHLLYPADPREYFEGLRIPNSGSRPFNVDVADGTVLDVLNTSVREEGELGWWVSYGDASERHRFSLTLGHYGNGPTFGWPARPALPKR